MEVQVKKLEEKIDKLERALQKLTKHMEVFEREFLEFKEEMRQFMKDTQDIMYRIIKFLKNREGDASLQGAEGKRNAGIYKEYVEKQIKEMNKKWVDLVNKLQAYACDSGL